MQYDLVIFQVLYGGYVSHRNNEFAVSVIEKGDITVYLRVTSEIVIVYSLPETSNSLRAAE